MKTKLILTIFSIIVSFTSAPPNHVLNTVITEKPAKPIPLATVREWPTLSTKSQIPVATPPATAAVAVPTPSTGCSGYLPLIEQYNWPVNTMYAIMQAESSCNPYAYNSSGCYGLFQLYGQDITDPAANIAAAYQIYLSQGLSAWSSYTSGAYLQYLN